MAGVCLLILTAGFMTMYGLSAEITEENAGSVFVSQQSAHAVLQRIRRYNSGHLEEVLVGNLERECLEETCTMEEAREVFENEEKTMEFWVGYADGDQCKPLPCQNGGQCKDGVNSYICWCKPNFNGKNCEIELSQQCAVNNGGCGHFCVMDGDLATCHCADGYQLGSDMVSCEPTVQFSCGRVNGSTSQQVPARARRSSDATRVFEMQTSNNYEDLYDFNSTYDDYEINANESFRLFPPNDNPAATGRSLNSGKVLVNPLETLAEADGNQTKDTSWAVSVLPSINAKDNNDQRIVGGNEAVPGEIPWQAALMSFSDSLGRYEPFCGGSLLNDRWVITAGHCVVQVHMAKKTYFVRLGEHDVVVPEDSERDHEVAEEHIHHMYNFKMSPYNHDIALLKLTSPVELSNKRRPICLGPKEFAENLLRESPTSLVSGWGAMKFLGLEATRLQKLEVPYVDRMMCKKSSSDRITRFMFCAGFKSELKDSCQGDSGGPHATKYKGTWFLTGIVSWGEECARDGKYGIYTRVSRYYPWISKTMQL